MPLPLLIYNIFRAKKLRYLTQKKDSLLIEREITLNTLAGTVAGHVPEARARSIKSLRSQRPYLLKDSSLSPIYPVPQSCPYSPLSIKSPHTPYAELSAELGAEPPYLLLSFGRAPCGAPPKPYSAELL